jgi:FAD/FMN-containing dehydrogenase
MSTQSRQPEAGGHRSPIVNALRAGFRGRVFESPDDGYDQARRVYNANIDRYPGLIAQCRDVTDVIAAIDYARRNGKAAAIRGGGHSVSGMGTCDGDVLIDLSTMRGVRVDPTSRRVRVEAGCTIGKVDHATYAFGLAVPAGIISTTGVAGLTLGGGLGHLSRQHGLTCDNLVSADVVTSDGEMLVADARHHEDLLWAIKGGGGNFGVVTSFEFCAHPVSTIIGGPMFWPIEQARELFELYDDFIDRAPEQMGAFANFHLIPPVEPFPADFHGQTMCGVVACFNGPETEAREVLEPLVSKMPPSIDLVGPMPFPQLQRMFDDLEPPGLHHYWKTVYLRELSDAAIEAHLEFGPKLANIHTCMHMYPINGAVHRVGPHETAFNHRDVKYAINIVGVGRTADELTPIRQWVREYFAALEPNSTGAGYVNFMMGDEDDKALRATFGDNYDRLVEVKDDYDPHNLFRVNHNIRPSKETVVQKPN